MRRDLTLARHRVQVTLLEVEPGAVSVEGFLERRDHDTRQRGFELFWEALKGATPALAPAAMAHLGLVGLAYSYHHPLLTERG